MHSAKILPRCGVGRKVELWYLLLFLYLQWRTSQHFLSVAPAAACSSPPGTSAARAQTPPSVHQWGEPPSGPPSFQAEIQGNLECTSGEPGALPARSRRYTVSHAIDVARRRSPRQSSSLDPGRAGSILFVFASLLIGKADGKHRAALTSGVSASVLRAQDDVFITDANSRELAIAFALLTAAERHFRRLVSMREPLNNSTVECSAASERRASVNPRRAKETSVEGVLWSRCQMQRCASTDTVWSGSFSSSSRSAQKNAERGAPMSLFRATSQNTLTQHGDSRVNSKPITSRRPIIEKKQDSLKQTPTGARTRGSRLLKYLFSGRPQPVHSPPIGDKVQIPVQCSAESDRIAWAGVMVAVSNAICKACVSFEADGGAENVMMQELSLYPPKHFHASPAAASGVDMSTAEPSRRSSAFLGDIVSEDGTVDSDESPGFYKRVDAKKSQSEADSRESSPACSGGKEQRPSKKNAARRKASSLPKLLFSPAKGVSSSREKPASVSSSKPATHTHSDSRRRPVDRDSASSSSPQPQSPHASTRSRRWLRFRANKSPEKTGEVAAGVQEVEAAVMTASDEEEALGEMKKLKNKPCEEAVRRALEAEGTSPLITTAASLWELSKTVRVAQVTEKVRSYVLKDDSMHDAVVSALEALSIKATKFITADIRTLLYDAAEWIDWKCQDETISNYQAESFQTNKDFRYALGMTCAEHLDTSITNAFSKAILEEAELLQKEFVCLAKKVSPDVPLMLSNDSLPDLVAKMQALIATIRALNIKDGAAVAVGQAHTLLTALADTLDGSESGECVCLYRRNVEAVGRDRELLVSDVAATSEALKDEIVAQVFQAYLDAVQHRLSREASPASVKQALKEVLSFIVRSLVSQSVETDMQQAAALRPESSFPRFYHLLGLLSDSNFRADIVSYHITKVKKALPCTFYDSMAVLLPRLAKEYSWLRQTAALGVESLFHRDCTNLNTRVRVLVALSEVLNLTHNILVAKLRRTVKVAKQLDVQTAAQAIDYINEQLTSAAREDREAVLACIRTAPQIASSGHSLKELLILPPACSPNGSGS